VLVLPLQARQAAHKLRSGCGSANTTVALAHLPGGLPLLAKFLAPQGDPR
jgi:hypothetical protein